jgi:YgiT-type zinc finger domain-containing protein
MIGEPEKDRCYFCGGKLTPGLTTLPFVVGTKVVVIKDVPAEVCNQCSEAVMPSEVAAVVDRLLKQVERSGFEVTIVTYEQLTLVPA